MWIKIIFSFLSALIVFVISSITFFWSGWKSIDSYVKLDIQKDGYFTVIKDWTWTYIENTKTNEWLFFWERFDYIDTIYSDIKNNYVKDFSWNSRHIQLGKWKYFFSFWESRKYEVSWSWFNLSVYWPVNFYINFENSSKVSIFSLDNTLELSLLWLDDNEEKTNIYIYPHMLFSFKPSLNRILKNSDLLRVSQINEINYVKDSLYSKKISLDEFSSLNNEFFKNILSYFYYQYLLHEGTKLSVNTNFDTWIYDNIKKYFIFFVNDNKKIGYYKDMIYINLFKIWYLDINEINLYNETVNYFGELQKLDKKSYDEMLTYLIYFKTKILFDYDVTDDFVAEKKNYDEMYSRVLSFQNIESNYLLYSIFNSYDLWEKDKFFNWLISFSEEFLWSNWLKIEKDKLSWYTDAKSIKLWYYILFLEDLIKSNLWDDFDINNTKYIFEIFNKYSLLSVNIYSSQDDNKKKTLIFLHLNLLKDLEKFFRQTFFESELENWKILVKKKWYEVENNLILSFENSFNNLLNFFNKNKWIFDESLEKDSLYLNDYNDINKKFTEYISALKDYENYKVEKSDLWNIKTIWWDSWSIVYNLENINEYISHFNWLNNDSYKVSTSDDSVFNISMNIWWKNIVFDLFPYDSFYLRNLFIDWVKNNWSYNLSSTKEKWDENYKKAFNSQDKDKYNFSNFFINTFLKVDGNITIVVDNNNWETKTKEDTYILVFKRDKLLWPNWEFYILKDFSNIVSDNIIVTDVNWKYSIELKDVELTFNYLKDNKPYTNWAYLSSLYMLTNSDHYFKNVKLKLFKILNWKKNYWLWDNLVSISWDIDIRDFKNFMQDVLEYYDNYVIINNLLSEKSKKIFITVNSNKVVTFSFIYNWKNFEFSLDKNNIVSIKVDFKEKIRSPFNYSSLQDYINLLVN